jgi:glycerol kinase
MGKYILALDQGTTSSRAIIFDKEGNILGISQKEFPQIYPKPGWVEHDPIKIWETQKEVAIEVLEKTKISPYDIVTIGITNQRETTIIWDKTTGLPIYNAIVWQCRRTSSICDDLKNKGLTETIKEKTGLVIDAYFSATKIKWILDNIPSARKRAEKGELLFGTVDSWLIWNLTGGKVHITDYSNASRTMLFNIHKLDWDDEILKELNIPREILPKPMPSSYIYGTTDPKIFGVEIPISGCAGDQQSALFGQTCFEEGMAKNTYGTGCFILLNTGEKPVISKSGILTTIAWGINNKIYYAQEGSIFIGGAVIQWLRDQLGIIKDANESEEIAMRVSDNNGVYFVPAFVGLGAPYWDMYARGLIIGLTRGVKKEHIVRSALESIAYQTMDVISIMEEESGIKLKSLRVDGGASKNNFLMQFQADILGVPVLRPKIIETTALGTAFLAGLSVGYFKNQDEIIKIWKIDREFLPNMQREEKEKLYRGWKRAVERAKSWEES